MFSVLRAIPFFANVEMIIMIIMIILLLLLLLFLLLSSLSLSHVIIITIIIKSLRFVGVKIILTYFMVLLQYIRNDA